MVRSDIADLGDFSVMLIATSSADDALFRAEAGNIMTADAVLREHTIRVDDSGKPARMPSLSLRFRSRLPGGSPLEDHVGDILNQLRAGDARAQENFFKNYSPTLSVRVVARGMIVPSVAFSVEIIRKLARINCDLDIDVEVTKPNHYESAVR